MFERVIHEVLHYDLTGGNVLTKLHPSVRIHKWKNVTSYE
jgi:hypothetical protein